MALLSLPRAWTVSSCTHCDCHSSDCGFSCRFPCAGGCVPVTGSGQWFLTAVPSSHPAQEFDKLSDFFKAHYRLELAEKDLCVKGWNWGTVRFGGELW